MNKKHREVFAALFEKPNRKDINWDDFIALLIELGAAIKRPGGSAVGVRLNGIYAVFHRPHPGPDTYVTDLKRIRRFLTEAGVQKVE